MNYYERIQYNTNFFSLLDYDKNKTNDIKNDVIEDDDIEIDFDFLLSIATTGLSSGSPNPVRARPQL